MKRLIVFASVFLLSIFVVKKGIGEISKLNVVIVPILIFVTIIISVSAIVGFDEIYNIQDVSFTKSTFSAILYVAYNVVMSISILPALAVSTDDKRLKRVQYGQE